MVVWLDRNETGVPGENGQDRGTPKEATLRTISDRSASSILVLVAVAAIGGCGTTLSPAPIVRASATVAPADVPDLSASVEPTPSAVSSLSAVPSASAGASAGTAGSQAPSSVPTSIAFDPSKFTGTVDNAWFPLVPGTTFVYQGTKEGQTAVDTVAVTSKTKVIAGVKALAVHHDLALDGVVTRRTDDWFAQDRLGNVWHLGRATVEGADPGEPDEPGMTEGSWEAGAAGAQPGIVMPANPKVGDSRLRAVLPGKMEDHFVVLLTNGTAKVPAGTFSNVLQTEEWTPFVPQILTLKAYVKGTGLVREAEIAGGDDVLELVNVTRP